MAAADENKAVVKAAYEGMAGGDPKAFLAALHPDATIHEPDPLPYGGSYSGHEEIIGFMKEAAGFVAGAPVVDHLVAEDEHVMAVIRLPLRGGSEATMVEHWAMRDGKASELRVFWFDPTTAAA